jgi:hypothetical protein
MKKLESIVLDFFQVIIFGFIRIMMLVILSIGPVIIYFVLSFFDILNIWTSYFLIGLYIYFILSQHRGSERNRFIQLSMALQGSIRSTMDDLDEEGVSKHQKRKIEEALIKAMNEREKDFILNEQLSTKANLKAGFNIYD